MQKGTYINMEELIYAVAGAEDFCKSHNIQGWSSLRLIRRKLSKKGYADISDMFDIRDIKDELNLPDSLSLCVLLDKYFN